MPCMGRGGNCPIGNWCVCQWAYRSYIARGGKCLDLQCDAARMISAGSDGNVKRWVWSTAPSASDEASGKKSEYDGNATKHIFGPGDSMKKLSMAYNTPLAKVRRVGQGYCEVTSISDRTTISSLNMRVAFWRYHRLSS